MLEAKYFGVPVIEGTSVIFGSSKVQRESAALVLMEMYTWLNETHAYVKFATGIEAYPAYGIV